MRGGNTGTLTGRRQLRLGGLLLRLLRVALDLVDHGQEPALDGHVLLGLLLLHGDTCECGTEGPQGGLSAGRGRGPGPWTGGSMAGTHVEWLCSPMLGELLL